MLWFYKTHPKKNKQTNNILGVDKRKKTHMKKITLRKTTKAGAKKMYFKSGYRKRKAHLRELEKVVRVEVCESGDWVRVERVSERGVRVERVSVWELRGWVREAWEWRVCDCLILKKAFMKSSLRDSVSRWLPHGSTTSFSKNTNRCLKGRDITRVSNTRVPSGCHVKKRQFKT